MSRTVGLIPKKEINKKPPEKGDDAKKVAAVQGAETKELPKPPEKGE